ncbi:MAG: hypothetical protein F6K34_13275, partial [Okeania sp. SIO4D6]|nr:hypothetical protein [Okeania sp. SIO4D6]
MSNTSDKFSSIKLELESSKVRLTQIKTELNRFKSKSDLENSNQLVLEYQNNQIIQNHLLATTGFLQKVAIENQVLFLEGWVVSFEDDLVDNFKLSIAGEEIQNFELELRRPSLHLKKAFPKLKNVDQAGFLIKLPFNQEQHNWQDVLVILTPLFGGREGLILVNSIQSSIPIPSAEYLKW